MVNLANEGMEGVVQTASPTVEAGQQFTDSNTDPYSFMDEDGNVAEEGQEGAATPPGASTSASPTEQKASADAAQAAKGDPAASANDGQSQEQPKHPTQARINKLVAKQREADERALKAEFDRDRYREAYELIHAKFAEKHQRLSDLGDIDQLAQENERLKLQQEWSAKETVRAEAFKKQVAEREKQARFEAHLESSQEQIEGHLATVLTQYPLVTEAELKQEMFKLHRSGQLKSLGVKEIQAKFSGLAKDLHSKRDVENERYFLSKYKDRMSPPSPVKAVGSMVAPKINTREDLYKALDEELGPGWDKDS